MVIDYRILLIKLLNKKYITRKELLMGVKLSDWLINDDREDLKKWSKIVRR